MKEKLIKNPGLKLLSLFCAFFVWLAVVNVANPIKTSTREVQVDIVNGAVLDQANLTYSIVGKSTATVSFTVRTRDDYRVRSSDFRAYADISEMYDVTGSIPVKIEVLNNEELLQTTPVVRSPGVIKIQTEEMQTKTFTLESRPEGTLAEGYQPGTITFSPAEVRVRGPISLMGQINSVGIVYNIEGAESDVSGTATPIYFDANGNQLNNLGESVKTLSGDVSYTMQVLRVKNVPIDYVVTGEVAAGYRLTDKVASISSVPIAGLRSDLASISTLVVQDPALNIDGATADRVVDLDLNNYLSSNLTIAGMEHTTVTVTLKIEPLTTRNYNMVPADVTVTGQNDGYSYALDVSESSVNVRGLREDLDSLSTASMNIQIDVSGLEPGTHQVSASIQLDDAFEVVSYPDIAVTVEEQSAPASQTAGQQTAEGQTENETNTEESVTAPESSSAHNET